MNLSLNSLHFRFDSLLSGDCHAMSRRCRWNRHPWKGGLKASLNITILQLVFLLYLTPKNKRQDINWEGFSVCVFRRLILGFKYMFTRIWRIATRAQCLMSDYKGVTTPGNDHFRGAYRIYRPPGYQFKDWKAPACRSLWEISEASRGVSQQHPHQDFQKLFVG